MTTATEPIRQPPPHLVAAQQKHSRDKRLRVPAVLQAMIDEGAIITFAEVARRAGVSRSLVYTRGSGRTSRSGGHNPPSQQSASSRTGTTLRSAAAEETQDKLRSEVADLRRALREKLGAEVEFGDAVSLRCEIDELQHDNDALRLRISELDTQLDAQRTQCIALEDALSASRELVKKMIRNDTRPEGG